MNKEVAVCSYELCGVEFIKTTHNMKYCTEAHCKLATNARIMKKYYESKARRKGAKRLCACGTRLSRYNEKRICSACEARQVKEKKNALMEMLKKMDE